jgi:hypothetical protein
LDGDVNSSNISAAGKPLRLFGWILHQTHSQLSPYVEPSKDEQKDMDLPVAV